MKQVAKRASPVGLEGSGQAGVQDDDPVILGIV